MWNIPIWDIPYIPTINFSIKRHRNFCRLVRTDQFVGTFRILKTSMNIQTVYLIVFCGYITSVIGFDGKCTKQRA